MRQILLATTFLLFCVGCNVNENKEARIRKLESQIEKTTDKLQEFENRILALESDVDPNEN